MEDAQQCTEARRLHLYRRPAYMDSERGDYDVESILDLCSLSEETLLYLLVMLLAEPDALAFQLLCVCSCHWARLGRLIMKNPYVITPIFGRNFDRGFIDYRLDQKQCGPDAFFKFDEWTQNPGIVIVENLNLGSGSR
jgi:hypothetical protein